MPPKKKLDINALTARFEENPAAFMAGAGALFMGMSKIIDAVGSYRGSAAYAKDVDRRVKKEQRQK
jgi:hypothetical protein